MVQFRQRPKNRVVQFRTEPAPNVVVGLGDGVPSDPARPVALCRDAQFRGPAAPAVAVAVARDGAAPLQRVDRGPS
ncbi:hypothetical protein [Pseudonocardia endophytica]|uniref:Uncharacterized protein n=1 Tax=Pseudonocardia endophytica TaxID=401976 RepID=A0A4R1HLG8_PSEEN|nr:hypothetical protein [Pseudonocardia endophytica]TCK21150.1 hypothetical protein EV378_5129 [Pseudonocardia endophytica]